MRSKIEVCADQYFSPAQERFYAAPAKNKLDFFFSFVDEQYTCGPLVYSVYGHVAGVTRSTTVKAEEAARWRSIIAVTAENKYQIIKSLFKTTKRGQQHNRRRWYSFNLHKNVCHGRSTLFVADNY